MAPGATTISGGFGISDTGGIEAFVENIVTGTTSGATVFTYADGSGQKVFVGVVEGRG